MDVHVVDSMTCPICFELANDAVETSCCHHVYCEYCLSIVGNRSCPQCRQPFKMLVSHISRRIIGAMPVPCTIMGCTAKVMRSELKDHEMNCIHRLFKCPAPKCLFEGLRKEFAMHIATEHEQNLVTGSNRIFQKSSGSQLDDKNASAEQYEDRVGTKRNENGTMCRLGSSGKYYCGRRLDGRRYY